MVHAVIKEKYHPALTLQPASMLVPQQQIQSSEFYVALKVPPSILRDLAMRWTSAQPGVQEPFFGKWLTMERTQLHLLVGSFFSWVQ